MMILSKKKLLLASALVLLSVTACDKPEDKHAKYMQRGQELFEKGALKEARLEYKNAARILPSDAEVMYRLGLVEEADNNLALAFKAFMAAEQQNAHHKGALLKLTQYFIAGGQIDEAQKRVNTLLTEAPQEADAHALNAALHLRRKAFEDTQAEAQKALALDANNVIAYTVLTGLYVAQSNEDKARATVDEAVAKNPKNVPLLLLKAMMYEKADNIDKVAEAYKVIFDLRPTDIKYRDNLAQVFTQAHKLDEAERVLREGVAAAPQQADMKRRLVQFLDQSKGIDAAEQQIRAFIAENPDSQDYVFWLADLYIAHKDVDRAIALLQDVSKRATRADEKAKDSLTAQTSLARIHYSKGDRALAEKLVEAVLAQDPNNVEALGVKAQLLFEVADYQQAVATLRTIVRDKPNNVQALMLLSESLLAQGYLDLAIDTMSQLVQAAPADVPSKVRLAQLYASRKDYDRAYEFLDLVIKIDPNYPVAWETVARMAVEGQDWKRLDEALARLEKMDGQAITAVFLRAQAAAVQDKVSEALTGYQSVINENPTAPIAQHAMKALAALYKKSGRLEDGVNYFSSAPGNKALALTLLGQSYVGLKKMDEAAKAFDAAIAERPAEADAYIARATLFAAQKNVKEALALLDQHKDVVAKDPRALLMQADLLASSRQVPQALALYERILAIYPSHPLAANNAAQLIADFMPGDKAALEKARVLAERFIRSTNPGFLDTLAWVYFRQGNADQALTIYDRLFAGDTKGFPPVLSAHYGLVLAQLGLKDKAVTYLQAGVAAKEPFEGLEEAKKTLSTLK